MCGPWDPFAGRTLLSEYVIGVIEVKIFDFAVLFEEFRSGPASP
jgi:hypothetical protein